jgi:hypothetical protein
MRMSAVDKSRDSVLKLFRVVLVIESVQRGKIRVWIRLRKGEHSFFNLRERRLLVDCLFDHAVSQEGPALLGKELAFR